MLSGGESAFELTPITCRAPEQPESPFGFLDAERELAAASAGGRDMADMADMVTTDTDQPELLVDMDTVRLTPLELHPLMAP